MQNTLSGIVFDVQKFSVHDGPGIRTTVFLKGCPLRCMWCHNPESWQARPEILYTPDKCVACGACVPVCPENCHRIDSDSTHHFNRSACIGCGECAEHCFHDALNLCGAKQTVDSVMKSVLKDRLFYENSGGGMTVSGGEPMFQFEFTYNLVKQANEEGIHVCLETCGFASRAQFCSILPFVDLFLFDVKTINAEKHRRFTGKDNVLILENLRFLNSEGAGLHLRCPLIPGLNDSEEELSGIGALADTLDHVRMIEVQPYHPLGVSKAHRLGLEDGFEAPFATAEQSDRWIWQITASTSVPVRKQ